MVFCDSPGFGPASGKQCWIPFTFSFWVYFLIGQNQVVSWF